MKKLQLTLLLAGSGSLAAPAAQAGSEDPATTSSVTVVVSHLVSNKSAVKLYFYNLRDKFLKPNGYVFKKVVLPAGQPKVTLPVELAHGEWAVAITQDTNNNDKLDKNFLGIPTEPFAFSNNVRPKLSPPAFEDCKFTVTGAGTIVTIKLKD